MTLEHAIYTALQPEDSSRLEEIDKEASGDVENQGQKVTVLAEMRDNKMVGQPCFIEGSSAEFGPIVSPV